MCFFNLMKGRKSKNMSSTKVLENNITMPGIRVKPIGFASRPITHTVRRLGKDDIIFSGSKAEVITPAIIKQLNGKPVKIRFTGVPRARIGEIVSEIKSNDSTVYIRAVRQNHTKRIAHYDVMIVKDGNNER